MIQALLDSDVTLYLLFNTIALSFLALIGWPFATFWRFRRWRKARRGAWRRR